MLPTEFEIHVCRDGRWSVAAIRPAERGAVEYARALLAAGTIAGPGAGPESGRIDRVKVVRIRRGWTGREYTAEVFADRIVRPETPFTAPGPADSAPLCETVADLYTLQARIAAGRLVRRYLDHHGLTPIELLHSHRELKRLIDTGMLVPNAIGALAAAQAQATGRDVRHRIAALHGLIAEACQRLRTAEAGSLPALTGGDLRGLIAGLGTADDAGRFRVKLVLTRELVTIRSLPAKLDRLIALFALNDDPDSAGMLDGFAADILASGEMIRDLIGPRRSLAAALTTLIRLQRGIFEPEGRGDFTAVAALARLFAAGRLAQCSVVVIDRVRRELLGSAPLVQGCAADQAAPFAELVAELVTPWGPLGGPPMAVALVGRQTRLTNQGGATGTGHAIATIGAQFQTVWEELRFALSLAESTLAADFAADIAAALDRTLDHLRTVDGALRQFPTAEARLGQLVAARRTLNASRLTEEQRTALARRLDYAIDRYRERLAGGPAGRTAFATPLNQPGEQPG